jgi:rhodanese-related sulfurtransferase
MMTAKTLSSLLLVVASVWLSGCEQAARPPATSGKAAEIELQFEEKAVGQVVPSSNAYELRQQGADIVFVSVREPAEWDEYHIPGAISIPHSKLKEQDEFSWKLLEELSKTHDYVLTYCGAGHRSGFVANEARDRKLNNVYNLDGISFWKKSFPVTLGEKRPADKEPKMIHVKEAFFYYSAGFDDVDFIDVREPESIALRGGNIIKGSKVIPLSELLKHLDEIDCSKDTVFICEGNEDGGECTAGPAAGKIVIDKRGCKAGHIKYLQEGYGGWEKAGHPVEPYTPE